MVISSWQNLTQKGTLLLMLCSCLNKIIPAIKKGFSFIRVKRCGILRAARGMRKPVAVAGDIMPDPGVENLYS